jgi:hypothetical protein
MSLYQVINNEAVDEDQKIYRQVVELMKKNIIDNKEKASPQPVLDTIQKNVIKKTFSILERQIYKLLGYIEQRTLSSTAVSYDVGDVANLISNIISAYNNISSYLENISYDKLSQGDKQFINTRFPQYIAPLKLIITSLEKNVDSSILAPLSDIIENITLKNYKQSGYALSDLVESTPRRQQIQKTQKTLAKITNFAERFNSYSKIRAMTAQQAKQMYFKLSGIQATTAEEAKRGLINILDQYKAQKATALVPAEEQEEQAAAPAEAAQAEEPEEEPEEELDF